MTHISHFGSPRGITAVLLAATALTSGAHAGESPPEVTFAYLVADQSLYDQSHVEDLSMLLREGGVSDYSQEDVSLAMAIAYTMDAAFEWTIGYERQFDDTQVVLRAAEVGEDGIYHATIVVGAIEHELMITAADMTNARSLVDQAMAPVVEQQSSWLTDLLSTVLYATGLLAFWQVLREVMESERRHVLARHTASPLNQRPRARVRTLGNLHPGSRFAIGMPGQQFVRSLSATISARLGVGGVSATA